MHHACYSTAKALFCPLTRANKREAKTVKTPMDFVFYSPITISAALNTAIIFIH